MDMIPQLEFDGNCEEAFRHYANLFSGEIAVMNRLGDSPTVPLPPGSRGGDSAMVRFAEVHLGKSKIRGNDVPPGDYRVPSGFNLSVHAENSAEAHRIFKGLSQGGTVTLQPAKVAWAAFFVMVTDSFGIPWLILGLSE